MECVKSIQFIEEKKRKENTLLSVNGHGICRRRWAARAVYILYITRYCRNQKEVYVLFHFLFFLPCSRVRSSRRMSGSNLVMGRWCIRLPPTSITGCHRRWWQLLWVFVIFRRGTVSSPFEVRTVHTLSYSISKKREQHSAEGQDVVIRHSSMRCTRDWLVAQQQQLTIRPSSLYAGIE